MTAWHTRLLVASLTAGWFCGCFESPKTEVYAAERDPPQALSVEDRGGAAFSALRAPRAPALRLSFAARPPPDAAHALVLLRGTFHGAFLARFSSARQSSAFKQRLVALNLEAQDDALVARPAVALEPGARYTLGWLVDAASTAFDVRVSTSPAAGARLVESWPSAGDTRVPQQLASALLRFDGSVLGDLAAHITLTSNGVAMPVALTREPCAARGLEGGDCAWLSASLQSGAQRLSLAAGLTSSDGTPIEATDIDFRTGPAAAPSFTPIACALDEQAIDAVCVRSDEAQVFVRGAASTSSCVGTPDRATLTLANTFTLASAEPSPLTLRDLAGQTSTLEIFAPLVPELARVTIDELRADPLGKEPAQEYVELFNFGDTPVSLAGFSITRDVMTAGRRVATDATLAPGERALLVSPDFDVRDTSDGALPGGIQLVALDGPLSLGNAGDSVFLRDARGRRVAAATSFAGLVEGQCSARYRPPPDLGETAEDSEPRRGDAAAFELDPDGACTPGRATFPTSP